MKKKHITDVYVGGERDPEKVMIPKDLGHFFNKERLLVVFVVLVVLLLLAGARL
jgi:hypothetical protein